MREGIRRGFWALALVPVLLLSTGAAQAQNQFRCQSPSGSSYVSSQPCVSSGSKTAPTYFGPPPVAASEQRYERPAPRINDAPPTVQYMSPRCSSLNDAIRTAPSRGLTYETIAGMQKSYRQECAENEQEAYGRIYKERVEKVQQRQAEQVADRQARDRDVLKSQQCGESKRILANKRARTDLTEGEKNDLQRFEDNFRSRCG